MDSRSSIKVALARCPEYEHADLPQIVQGLLESIGCRTRPGDKVLVKPNLLAPTPPDFLPCTHPSVVRAVCQYLVDSGATVRVGDSPTFGQAIKISGQIGLTSALADLPVTLVNLDRPKLVRLSFGGRTAISREALESDLIVSVPKLKAHHQVRVTGAVKNVYGCVTGLRKPLFHLLYGDWGGFFEKMLLEIWQNLPPSVSLMDAITAMHVHGPNNGEPYQMELLAASSSPVALDSAIMNILGMKPEDAPLWKMSLKLNLPGARLEEIVYPLDAPESFNGRDFKLPEHLFPLSFRPLRIVGHWMRRWLGNQKRPVKA